LRFHDALRLTPLGAGAIESTTTEKGIEMRDDDDLQYYQEWGQFQEELELQDLNAYLNELPEYHGNRQLDRSFNAQSS
jgi:hypothetical protein